MPQAELDFKVSHTDATLIAWIVARAKREYPDHIDDPRSLSMDLTACHATGCLLDLPRLLAADGSTFARDVFGIAHHMDRETGKLLHCFVPRFVIRL